MTFLKLYRAAALYIIVKMCHFVSKCIHNAQKIRRKFGYFAN